MELLKLEFQQNSRLPLRLLNRVQLKCKYQISKLLNQLSSSLTLSNMLLREELRILSNSKQMINKPANNNISKQPSQLFRMFLSFNYITKEAKMLPSKLLKHKTITG
jgi:hypothetical protein